MLAYFEKLVDPYPDNDGNNDSKVASPSTTAVPNTLLKFLWHSAQGTRPFILAVTVLTAIVGFFEAILFAMLGNVVDWLGKSSPATLWAEQHENLILLALVVLASPLMVFWQAAVKHQSLMGNFPMRLRWNFHRAMLSQSMSFYQDEFAGRIATKVMQTALAVRDVWMMFADILVYVLIYFGTIVVVLAAFEWRMMLPFLLWLCLYIACLRFFVPRLGKIAQAQADARAQMTGRVTDAYTNISTVKLFSHAQREAAYVKRAMQEFMGTVYTQWRYITHFDVANQVLSAVLIAGTAGMSLYLWVHGQVSVGAVAAACAMAMRLNGMSHWVMWEFAQLFEHIGTVRDGMATLSKPPSIVDRALAAPLVVSRGALEFRAVDFSYGNKKKVLSNFNLVIKPGEKIGLVGRSGAGKSTLVNLLLRFYEPDTGSVLIDGQDISAVTQNSLRAQIGMVTQDTSLLHRSVRDNIVYGRPEASEHDMQHASQRAEADEFIQHLHDQKGNTAYDAQVGERGVKLSGGQRQRIAIARVMLKDAPILLLDEATSALDSEVEAAIQASLYRLMQGKTVVAIAHRLSTISAMDRLIVLDEGQIIEEGSHAELLQRNGLYARLWAHQSGGFLGEN
ncbi:MAG: hypothetical protein RLZZ502_567 [Pseudomonadota bacterium]